MVLNLGAPECKPWWYYFFFALAAFGFGGLPRFNLPAGDRCRRIASCSE